METIVDFYPSIKYVVGIGASAGGLEALQQLLEKLPSDTGFSYVIVQHLSPDYKSLLSEILSKYTSMPVAQAENGMAIESDCVYLIPPKFNMQLKKGKLVLSAQVNGVFSHPIDIFFRSLAADAKHKAVSIVLSGTGSDGTNGIKEIKEQEGFVIVQKADTAKFDGMPRSAMRTGLADAELSPSQIADELKHMADKYQNSLSPSELNQSVDDELMRRIYAVLKKISNINFTFYKQSTIVRRIERRMVITHKESLNDYVDFLYENADEVMILSKEVLIGVTNFFRDSEFFDSLKAKVITDIFKKVKPDETIRIWVAGCSTGEEVYSVAILCAEVMEELKISRSVKIFGTDLDMDSINTASKGIYGESISENVSALRLSKYFVKRNGQFHITKEIRRMVIFSLQNVLQDPPFGRLHLISCRNMMIYFQPVLQRDLFSIFHTALLDGGYLFLGKSEAVGEYTEVFRAVDPVAKIFQHRAYSMAKNMSPYPFFKKDSLLSEPRVIKHESPVDDLAYSSLSSRQEKETEIETSLLESYMPTCIVINDNDEIVHTFGDTANYLHFAIGHASLNLYDSIAEELKIVISSVLKEVRESKKKIVYKDICFRGEQNVATVNISVDPLIQNYPAIEGLIALVFIEQGTKIKGDNPQPFKIDRASSRRITDLEQEVKDLKVRLSKSVSEQETTTEELQAANEELLTSNEELQSSNEELQSVNEELYTVNGEYQLKLAELAETDADVANFLSSTMIGIIFVDKNLNIRKFTKYISDEFSILEPDIGRPLRFLSHNFPKDDIVGICHEVLDTIVPVEMEVCSSSNKEYMLRVSPYRTSENKILGLVLSLIDISRQIEDQKLLQNTSHALDLAQQASSAKSDFLSRMSHEIRTPMNAITGIAQLAKNSIETPKVVNNCIDEIINSVEYMNSIVSDILDMAKIENSEIELAYRPFSLTQIVASIKSMLDERMKSNNLTLKITGFEKAPETLYGDEIRVKQILTNFLSNSIKYTPEGGHVWLSLKSCSDEEGKANLVIEIKDDGIGIGKEFIPKLFNPFERESKSDSQETSSVGLGLSISKKLVSLMSGYIDVESEQDKGSVFTVHLIIDSVDKVKRRVDSESEGSKFHYNVKGLRALIAEDNSINRSMLQRMLSSQGMESECANDGLEAVEKYLNDQIGFDVILMDRRMPKVDGYEATDRIRSSQRSDARTIPVICVSADAFVQDVKSSKDHGLTDYLVKPINFNELFRKIAIYCKRV